MSEIKMVSKLSTKNAGVPAKKIHGLDKNINSLSLCKIFGIADGIKQVEDPVHGKIFYPLTGRFQGVNVEDGTKTRSGLLYLPSGIHETYEAAVRKLEEGESLTFAIEIRAVRAENPAGYSYEAVDLMPPQESDPLDEIAATLAAPRAQAKLPEPAKPAPVANGAKQAQASKK